jgi:glucose-6-phosphate 1-dehydrogenase
MIIVRGQERADDDTLSLVLEPHQSLRLQFNAIIPPPTPALHPVSVEQLVSATRQSRLYDRASSYTDLLVDVLGGDATLFARDDEVEHIWRWATGILEGFDEHPTNVHFYAAGTWGPPWSDSFIERDGRMWRRLAWPS